MPLSYTIAVIAIPLFMFLFLGLAGVKMSRKLTGVLGVIAMAVTTIIAYGVALTYFFGTGQGQVGADGVRQAVTVFNPAWLSFTDTMVVRMGILLDPIAAMMLIVVCTVSFMVHLYSLGYMSDHDGNAEQGFQRYYAFLALFTFSMLGLVVATNLFQIFVFFEMVGVSSYLLIGFYYSSPAANHASKKAFIVTRLADLFFLLGIMILSYYTKTFDFSQLVFGANGANDMAVAQSAMPCIPCTSGCPTPWKAPRPCRHSSMLPPWWWPVFSWWPVCSRSMFSNRAPWRLSVWWVLSPLSTRPP